MYTALPWGQETQLGQFCFVFLCLGHSLSLSFHLSPTALPPLSMVCSALSLAHVPWALADSAAVSRLRYLLWQPLSPERRWAAKGVQSLR